MSTTCPRHERSDNSTTEKRQKEGSSTKSTKGEERLRYIRPTQHKPHALFTQHHFGKPKEIDTLPNELTLKFHPIVNND